MPSRRRLRHRLVDAHDAVGDRVLAVQPQVDEARSRHGKQRKFTIRRMRALRHSSRCSRAPPASRCRRSGCASSDVGPTASAFWRVALAVPLAVDGAGARATRPSAGAGRSWPLLAAAGLAFAGDLAFWHWSIQYTSVANSTLLANLASIFVTLAAWLLWRQRPSGQFLVGLALALAGVVAAGAREPGLFRAPRCWATGSAWSPRCSTPGTC